MAKIEFTAPFLLLDPILNFSFLGLMPETPQQC